MQQRCDMLAVASAHVQGCTVEHLGCDGGIRADACEQLHVVVPPLAPQYKGPGELRAISLRGGVAGACKTR